MNLTFITFIRFIILYVFYLFYIHLLKYFNKRLQLTSIISAMTLDDPEQLSYTLTVAASCLFGKQKCRLALVVSLLQVLATTSACGLCIFVPPDTFSTFPFVNPSIRLLSNCEQATV